MPTAGGSLTPRVGRRFGRRLGGRNDFGCARPISVYAYTAKIRPDRASIRTSGSRPDMDVTRLITPFVMHLSRPLRILRIRVVNLSSSSSVRPNFRPACAAASSASLALLNGPIRPQSFAAIHQRTGGVHCCALRALRALLCTFLGPPMHGLRNKFSIEWSRAEETDIVFRDHRIF